MDLSRPWRSVAPSLDLGVLAALDRQERPYIAREIADFAGATVPGVRRVVERLVDDGLVTAVQVGRSRGYQRNGAHIMADPIRDIVRSQARLRARIVEAIDEWAHPAAVVALFGSAARAAADSDSDVDLLILRHEPAPHEASSPEVWEEQLGLLHSSILTWTGNHADVLSFTVTEWQQQIDADAPLVGQVLRDGILLCGQRSLLRHPRATHAGAS